MELNTMEQYWVWLSSIEGIGPKRFYELLCAYKDARTLWDAIGSRDFSLMPALPEKVRANLIHARDESYFYKLFERLEQLHARVLTRLDDAYPRALGEIYDPPPTLFVRGTSLLKDEKCFAIVGSRRCTRDGSRAATDFARTIATEKVCIVSGLASGIDTAAHEGALDARGRTIAVLGCGIDVVYPPQNDALYRRISDEGGTIISEYMPGTQPYAGNFPARNRIISGLCSGVLIVEGRERSGAMITVRTALEQNRDVFVVPGSIYSSLSAAPNKLLMEGAMPALSGWDILEHYRWAQRPGEDKAAVSKPMPVLDAEDEVIVKALREQECSFEELSQMVDFSVSKLNTHLTMLELRGIIVKVPGGLYRAY